ncbi:MAG: LuxR family transcriptional regulator [Bacteroidales bacterium]|nr:LuxR family transcriptional regulator [Bacteroidales bacterium]
MKTSILISLAAVFTVLSCPRVSAQYSDHRGRNVDSLEVAVARWTPSDIQKASDEELRGLVLDYGGLMQGYLQVNGVKSEFYARKMLDIAASKGWQSSIKDAAKIIGQQFWAREQYDSAAFYYNIALDALAKMAAGATSPTDPDGYDQKKIDDGYSSMYGTLGNLYSMMGDLDKAFEYYAKAGEIFDRYGWNESNAVLHYNMGETWYEEGDMDKALECYEKALEYGRTAGDSLWIASPLKGLGLVYFTQGKTRKGLRCLEEADKYFSLHQDQEFRARLETLGIMENALKAQRRQLVWIACILAVALLLLAGSILLARKLRKSRQDNREVGEILEETIEEIARPAEGPSLSDREKQILRLIAEGLTGPQIADKVCLSPETIKWYRKKLLAKFDAANTPELISKAKDARLL